MYTFLSSWDYRQCRDERFQDALKQSPVVITNMMDPQQEEGIHSRPVVYVYYDVIMTS